MIDTYVQYVGFYGPIIIGLINIFYLWPQKFYLSVYIVFLFLNVFINKGLKLILQDPRPKPNGGDFDDIKNYTGAEQYGMPSGHAQSAFFSIVFLYLVTGYVEVSLVLFFITILTLYQRWKSRKHTFMQLLAGSFVGGIIGFIVYSLSKTYKQTFSDRILKHIQ